MLEYLLTVKMKTTFCNIVTNKKNHTTDRRPQKRAF